MESERWLDYPQAPAGRHLSVEISKRKPRSAERYLATPANINKWLIKRLIYLK